MLTRLPSFGGWLQTASPGAAEILAASGFDWVCVDLEHGAIDVAQLPALFCAIERHGAVPVARLPAMLGNSDVPRIAAVIDAGAQGLILANVRSPVTAEELAQLAHRPPLGKRGWGYSRANLWGMRFGDPTDGAVLPLVAQIESRQGVGALEEILAVPGICGALIGPLDLAGDLGWPGQPDHPEVVRAKAEFLSTCIRVQKPAGLHVVRPTDAAVKDALSRGYSLLALGTDQVFLAEGARAALAAGGRG